MASLSLPAQLRRASLPRALDSGVLIPAAAALLLIYLTVVPLGMLILGSLKVEVARGVEALSLRNYLAAYGSARTFELLGTSLVFALGSCLLAFGLGTFLAWVVERTNTPFRGSLYVLTLVPLVIPGVLSTIAWIFLLSPRIGFVNVSLVKLFGLAEAPFSVFSLGGMIWVEGLNLSPLAFLMMSAAFKSMDPSLEESALTSGAGTLATLRRVTLRLLLPAVASTALILFVRGLEAFEVPALLGIPGRVSVFTSAIYVAMRQSPPDYGLAGALGVGLLALAAVGVWLYTRLTAHSERFQTVTGKAFRPRVIDLGPWRYVTCALFLLYFALIVGLPFFILLWASLLPFYTPPDVAALPRLSLSNYQFLLGYEPFLKAARNSLLLGLASATTVMLLTAVIAWITIKTRLPGRGLLDGLAFLPIGIPGLVLGISVIWLYLTFPLPIYGTLVVLVIAYTTRFLPYGMRASSASMVQIHSELEEAAQLSGSSWWATFRRVTLPLLRPGLVAGWIYVFVVSVRELSSSILLATSDSLVLSILVFDLMESGKSNAVAALAVLMITALLTIVAAVYRLSGRFGIRA